MDREERLLKNFQAVQEALSTACKKAARDPREVTLLAVTKYAATPDVLFLLKKGLIRHVGESRVQQALSRWTSPEFAPFPVVKHLIGHLQHNKAAKAARFFDFIDSLDDFSTAVLIDTHVPEGKTIRGLVQVKLTDRDTQSGLPLAQARDLARKLRSLNRLKICGYMAIAPQGATAAQLKTLFGTVKQAFDEDFSATEERYLSLGMSADFTTAIEAGSTLPRIGSKLFAENLEEAV